METQFGDVFGTPLNDYSGLYAKKDLEIIKAQIKTWIDEHCSFSANLDDNSVSNEEDYNIDDDLLINVTANINIRSDEAFPDYIKFGVIGASFFMMGQKCPNTNGFPKEVKDSIWLYDNDIAEITDFPERIHGNACLRHNKIKNLNGISTVIDGNLDVCDNDPNFDYGPRSDGKTITVGVSFYGSMPDSAKEEYKTDLKQYMDVAGDKDPNNAAFAYYCESKNIPVKIGNAKKGYFWHSKGEI